MPRVANSGEAVDAWWETHQGNDGGSSTYDVCSTCFSKRDLEAELKPYNGDPPGIWEEESSRPSYDDEDKVYCAICSNTLSEEEDG